MNFQLLLESENPGRRESPPERKRDYGDSCQRCLASILVRLRSSTSHQAEVCLKTPTPRSNADRASIKWRTRGLEVLEGSSAGGLEGGCWRLAEGPVPHVLPRLVIEMTGDQGKLGFQTSQY